MTGVADGEMWARSIAVAVVAALAIAWISVPAAADVPAKVRPRASEGCGTSKVGAGEQRVKTTSGAVPRAYFRHVPAAHDGERPVPLVLDLHGASEPAAVHKANSALGPFGDKHGFVTITPEGSGPVPHWDTQSESIDMRFLGDLLDELEQDLCIDKQRVFVAGYSNGAFIASAMRCVYGDRIAAVALVAGIRDVPGCKPARAVPAVAFHGLDDEFVLFDGGLGPGVTSLPAAEAQALVDLSAPTDSGVSVPEVAAGWAKRNGCTGSPQQRTIATDVVVERYQCPNRADVHLYEIEGAGHTWPGSQFSKSIEQFVGPTTFSIDADEIMWKFFRQHPLRRAPR